MWSITAYIPHFATTSSIFSYLKMPSENCVYFKVGVNLEILKNKESRNF